MNELALIIIGAFLGILALAMIVGILVVAYLAYTIRQSLVTQRTEMARVVARQTIATDRLRTDVQLALSSMDAERLHAASASIQRNVKQFAQATATLSKLVFAAGGDTDAILSAAEAQKYQQSANAWSPQPNPFDPPGFQSDISDEYIEPEQGDWRIPPAQAGPGPGPTLVTEWAQRHNAPEPPTKVPTLPDLDVATEMDALDAAAPGALAGHGLPDAEL